MTKTPGPALVLYWRRHWTSLPQKSNAEELVQPGLFVTVRTGTFSKARIFFMCKQAISG